MSEDKNKYNPDVHHSVDPRGSVVKALRNVRSRSKPEDMGTSQNDLNEEEVQLSFGEKVSRSFTNCGASMSQCWKDFKHLSHHVDQKGQDLYFNNTAENLRKILLAFAIIYTFWAFITWGLMEAALDLGTTLLWVYFVLFMFFVVIVAVTVVVGHFDYLKEERERAAQLAAENN